MSRHMAKTIWLVVPKQNIDIKSPLGACSEMPGLYSGDACWKRYAGYKHAKSTAFICSLSFRWFCAPRRHIRFDPDFQYIL